eukprot:Awhi_evm1s12261
MIPNVGARANKGTRKEDDKISQQEQPTEKGNNRAMDCGKFAIGTKISVNEFYLKINRQNDFNFLGIEFTKNL